MKKLLLFLIIALPLVSHVEKKERTWVAIRDSITWLNDHTDEPSNRVTKGYMTNVTEKITDLHYINHGYNGWTSGDVARHIDSLGIQRADAYSIFLGTNDWWQGRPIGTLGEYKNNAGNQTIYGSFRIIINKIRNLNNNADILIITPMQRVDFVYLGDKKNNAWGSYKDKMGQSLARVALAIDSIGKYENFKVLDLYNEPKLVLDSLVKYKRLKDPANGLYKNFPYPVFVNIPFDPVNDDYPYPPGAANMTYDGLHPSDKGFKIISDLLIKLMKD